MMELILPLMSSPTIFSAIPVELWVVILSGIGALALKAIEKFLNRNADARADKQDYREEIKELQDRLDKVEDEVTNWRTMYYSAQVRISVLEREIIKLGGDIPPDVPTK